jgi:AcrR family transcriptional regulator
VTPSAPASRQRILDAALSLMSEHGVAGTSMRMLAGAADLNVATLYHHFGSKEELLHAVLAERGYLERLRTDSPPASVITGRGRGPAARLEKLVRWLWIASCEEEVVWRLLVGESLRGNPSARAEAMALVDGVDAAIATWIADLLPELADRAEQVGRLVRAMLFSLIVEHLALGPTTSGRRPASTTWSRSSSRRIGSVRPAWPACSTSRGCRSSSAGAPCWRSTS